MKITGKLNKFLLSIFFFLITTSTVFAYEWGALVSTEVRSPTSDFTSFPVKNETQFTTWMSLPFSDQGNWGLKMEYAIGADFLFDSSSFNFDIPIDCNLFMFHGREELSISNLNFKAGRFKSHDLTEKIFNQNVDGLELEFVFTPLKFKFLYGFTALLNSNNVHMLNASGLVPDVDNKVYSISHSYMPVIYTLDFPSVFKSLRFGIEYASLFDLEKSAFNRNYMTLLMEWRFIANSFISAMSSFETFSNGNFSQVHLKIFASDICNINLGMLYASGDQGSFKPFRGFTSYRMFNSKSDFELSSFFMPEADFSILIGNTELNLFAKVPFDASSSDLLLAGYSAGLNLKIDIYTDLQLKFGADVFYGLENFSDETEYEFFLKMDFAF